MLGARDHHGHTKTDDELKCNGDCVHHGSAEERGQEAQDFQGSGTASSVVLCSGADVCQMCAGVCLFLRCGFEARPLSFGAYMEPSKIRALRLHSM